THEESKLRELQDALKPNFNPLLVSVVQKEGLERLKERIFNFLRILRVYSKIPGKKPDLDEPFIFRQGSTVMDMARMIHKDFAEKLRYARLWKKNDLHLQGVRVNREYLLQDEDIIELHL
ncbi:MAG: GTP-binding protein HSR1, partial [Candidatus Aminicenantes bacterium]